MAVKMADMTVVIERNKANPKPLAGQSLIFYVLPFGKSMWGGVQVRVRRNINLVPLNIHWTLWEEV